MALIGRTLTSVNVWGCQWLSARLRVEDGERSYIDVDDDVVVCLTGGF